MTRTNVVIVIGLTLAGCQGDAQPEEPVADFGADIVPSVDPGAPPPETGVTILEQAGFSLRVEYQPFALVLRRGTADLLRIRGSELQIGSVPAYDPVASYDPWPRVSQDPLYTPIPDLVWSSVLDATPTDPSDASAGFELSLEGDLTASLLIVNTAPGRYRLDVTLPQEPNVVFVRMTTRTDAAEGFYGLGEYFDDVNHRGKTRAMQVELDPMVESFNNEAHVPVPLLIGSTGWGLFVPSFLPGVFDVATLEDDRVDIWWGTGEFSDEPFVFHLFAAEEPLAITQHYYEVTSYPMLPARWALGPWVWRDENKSQAQVLSDIDTMRDLDLPANAIWIDRPYASGVNAFDWNPDQFTDPTLMISTIQALGFRLALWHTPYLDPDDNDTKALHQEAQDAGFYPPKTGAATSNWGAPIDFTNPDAFAWWQDKIRIYTDAGIEGFKLDYGEDVVLGIGGIRNEWGFADGSDERTMHSVFPLLYHRAYAELLPKAGGFLLCRAGTWGDQAITSVIWPGDLDADMTRHGDAVEKDGESWVAVGGMPASMIAGIGLGPSGYPFYGADTGGYRHSPPDKETFVRWFQQTALSSVMQIGTSSNDVAWEYNDKNGFDDESLDLYRIYTRLHLRLWPYEWTFAQRIAEDGRPIQRPIGLAYPQDGEHPWDQYLFGEDLLVAPVVVHGARERDVFIPSGIWVDWWNGASVTGPQTITVDAPLDTLPLWMRSGALIPMLRPSIDTLSPTTAVDRVDSYDNEVGTLYVRVAPADLASEFTLFDGTVVGQGISGQGISRQETSAAALGLTWTDGTEFKHGVWFEVHWPTKPDSVTVGPEVLSETSSVSALESVARGWFFDAAAGRLHVRVQAGGGNVLVQ